jgi:hypothetical protein
MKVEPGRVDACEGGFAARAIFNRGVKCVPHLAAEHLEDVPGTSVGAGQG